MAEELDDAQFWLPSHFLTDDDILMDFSPSTNKTSLGFGSGSDIELPSNGSDSDDDDSLSELTRQIASSVILPDHSPHSKGWNLSSSPQSTLCGCVAKEEGSSRDSPNVPVSPQSSTDKEGGATTLDLLNKAAGEVARFKMTNEKTTTTTSTRAGTGFFDCSNKGQFCPPPPSPLHTPTRLPFFPPLHFPPLSHVQQQMSMRQQMISSQVNIPRNKSHEQNSKNRPSGVPQPAWPPLQGQHQPIQRGPQMLVGQPGPKSDCVGTGVFLPRRVDTPVETRKKSEGGNPTKTRNGKNNKGSNSHHQRNGSRQPVSKSNEIRLPLEWTY